MQLSIARCAMTVLFFGALTLPAVAQFNGWTAFGANNNWNNSANWTAGVPDSADSLLFDRSSGTPNTATVVLNVDGFADQVFVSNNGGSTPADRTVNIVGGGANMLNVDATFSIGASDSRTARVNLYDTTALIGYFLLDTSSGAGNDDSENYLQLNNSHIYYDRDGNTGVEDTTIELLDNSSIINSGDGLLVLRNDSEIVLKDGSTMGAGVSTGTSHRVFVGSGGGRFSRDAFLGGLVQLNDGSSTLWFGIPNDDTPGLAIITGDISGPASLRVDGADYRVVLSGGKSFSGDIYIYGGTLVGKSGSSLGTLGKTIRFNFGGTYAPDGNYNTSLAMHFAGPGTIDTTDAGADHIVYQPWTGSGDFTKTGPNELRLQRVGTSFTGAYIVDEGVLRVEQSNALSGDNDFTVNAGATAHFAITSTIAGLSGGGSVVIQTGESLNIQGAPSAEPTPNFAGSFSGNAEVFVTGSDQDFSGDNSGFAGYWRINANSAGFLSPNAWVGDTIMQGGIVEVLGGGTYNDVISGGGLIFKDGDNLFKLAGGLHTFTGTWIVQDGNLQLYADQHGSIEVRDGGTLSGFSVSQVGQTTIKAGGTLSPGAGFLTPEVGVGGLLLGDLTIEDGALTRIELGGTSALSQHDQVEATDLTFDGNLEVSLISLNELIPSIFEPGNGDTFVVLKASNTLTGAFDNVASGQRLFTTGGEGSFLVTYSGASREVVLSDYIVALPGDLDGDGDVDGVDLSQFFSNFTGPNLGPPADPQADLDGDGDVDGVDLSQAFAAFTGPLKPSNVPEPASLLLLSLGGLFLSRRAGV